MKVFTVVVISVTNYVTLISTSCSDTQTELQKEDNAPHLTACMDVTSIYKGWN